ncbi:MAG: hypothetical protein HQK53_18115, partial [Oligoflexia bacterium]|nr:hypothetical protein [Oligoflexia bacterium]
MPIHLEQRRNIKKGFDKWNYKNNRPRVLDFGRPDSPVVERQLLEKTSQHNFIEREIFPPAKVLKNIKELFKYKYAPLPLEASLEPKDDHPSIDGCVGITEVTKKLFVAEFTTNTNGTTGENIHLLVKSDQDYFNHATRGIAIVNAKEAEEINKRPKETLKGEFRIEGNIQDELKLNLVGSTNPDAPKLVSIESKTISKSNLSFIVLTLDNGDQIPIQSSSNSPTENQYLVRNFLGHPVFGYEYSVSSGVNLLSVPTLDQLSPEFRSIINRRRENAEVIPCPNSLENKKIVFVDFLHETYKYHTSDSDAPANEGKPHNAVLWGRQIDNYIKNGQFYDLKTAALAMVDQLRTHHMTFRKRSKDISVLLELVHDPVRGAVLAAPRLSLEYQDSSKPRLSTPQDSLDVQYSTSVTPEIVLANVKNIVAVPIEEVVKMIENLELDYETIGHLGTVLGQQDIFFYQKPLEYEPPPHAWR